MGLSFCTLTVGVDGLLTDTIFLATDPTGGGTQTLDVAASCEQTVAAFGTCTDGDGQVSLASTSISQTLGLCPRTAPLPPTVMFLP